MHRTSLSLFSLCEGRDSLGQLLTLRGVKFPLQNASRRDKDAVPHADNAQTYSTLFLSWRRPDKGARRMTVLPCIVHANSASG